MPSIIIRNIDQRTKDRLRMRAAQHKRSMEEEARTILKAALVEQTGRPSNLVEQIAACMRPVGGVDLEIPPRKSIKEPPRFDNDRS